MKNEPNGRAKMPQNLLLPRAELVYLPVTPEVARAVENAVQRTLESPCAQRRSAAGRAVLHAKGVSLPGVAGMNHGTRCHRPAQNVTGASMTKDAVSITPEPQMKAEEKEEKREAATSQPILHFHA